MQCEIEGVIIRPLTMHFDERGWLCELFRQDQMEREHFPVMSYVSMTNAGAVRGPHVHGEQSDCFAFIGPSSFQVYLWDARKESPSHLKKFAAIFGETKPTRLIIPAGVVHGYKNIGEVDGIVYNAPNRLYRGEGGADLADEVRYEDEPESEFRFEDFEDI